MSVLYSKGNNRGATINGKANKTRRREECYARLAAREGMSFKEKLSALPATGATRQRARYTAAIAMQKRVKA